MADSGHGEPPSTVLPCPDCGRRNRVPAHLLGQLATLRCAVCRQPLGPPSPSPSPSPEPDDERPAGRAWRWRRPAGPRPAPPDGEQSPAPGPAPPPADAVHTVLPCPACGRRNRVPAERLVDLSGVRCAACREPLGPPPVR